MPKFNFSDFLTKFDAFAREVRQNRTRCETRFAQVVHDRLIEALECHAGSCRRGVEIERLLQTETDKDARAALDDQLCLLIDDLETGGGNEYPWHLLDCINPDPGYGGYIDPITWIRIYRPIPASMTVSDEHLYGLGAIIERIAADTGIRFTTYLYYQDIGPEGAADLDPEIYEKPINNHLYR